MPGPFDDLPDAQPQAQQPAVHPNFADLPDAQHPNMFQKYVGVPVTNAAQGISSLLIDPTLADLGIGDSAVGDGQGPMSKAIGKLAGITHFAPQPGYEPSSVGERLYDNVATALVPMAGEAGEASALPGIANKISSFFTNPQVLASVGAGTGQTAAQEIAPDSVPAQLGGALLGAMVPAAGAGIAGSIGSTLSKVAQKFSPESVASNVLQKAVTTSGEAPAVVASRLAEAPSIAGGPGATPYAPTTGTVSNNPGLLSLEKGAAIKEPALAAQINQNRLATAQGLQASTAPQGAPPTAFSDFAAQRVADRTGSDAANVASAQNVLQDAQSAPVRGAGVVKKNTPAAVPAAASEEVIPALSDEQKALADKRNELYSHVPDETQTPTSNGLQAAQSIIGEMSPLARASGGLHPLVANYVKLYGEQMPEISIGGEPVTDPGILDQLAKAAGLKSSPSTLGEARQNQSLVNGAISDTTNNLHRRQLTLLKEGIQKDIDSSGQPNTIPANGQRMDNPGVASNAGAKSGNAGQRGGLEKLADNLRAGPGSGDQFVPRGGAGASAGGEVPGYADGEAQKWRPEVARLGKLTDAQNLRVPDPSATFPPLGEGIEHKVYFDPAKNEVIKRTQENGFGLVPVVSKDAKGNAVLTTKSASPSEYLDRLSLGNQVFGDNTKLAGVMKFSGTPYAKGRYPNGQGLSIVTRQPYRTPLGKNPEIPVNKELNPAQKLTDQEMEAFMRSHGFKAAGREPSANRPAGGGSEVPGSWYRDDGIVATDIHNQNIIKTKDGPLAIDIPLNRVSQDELASLKQAYDSKQPQAQASIPAPNTALKAANEFNKTEYGPRFGEGPGGVDTVKQAIQGKVLPTAAVSKALASPEGAQQLALAGGSRPEIQDAVKSEFFNRLANKLGNTPKSEDVRNFVAQNSDVLQHFPKVQSSLKSYGTSLAKKEGNVALAEGGVDAAKVGQKTNQADIAEHPIAPFVEGANSAYLNGKTPEQALSEVFSGKGSPVAKVKMLMQVAAKDESGAALEGLKNAAKDLISQAHTSGYIGEGNKLDFNQADFAASASKMGQWLIDGTPKSEAIRALFSKEELEPMQMVYRQMLNETRRSKGSLAGSQTAENLAASGAPQKSLAQQLAGKAIGGVADKLSGGMTGAAEAAAKGIGLITDKLTMGKAQELLNKALMDPELARTLLMRPTAATAKKINMSLAPYVKGAGASAVNARPGSYTPSIGPSEEDQQGEQPQSSTTPPSRPDLLASKDHVEVRRATLAPFYEQPPEVQKILSKQRVSKVSPAVIDHIMAEEGPTTIQDGKREFYGFRAGEGTGFDKIQKAVQQYGIKSQNTKDIVSELLEGRAKAAGADKFMDPGAQAAVATMAHMRGESGSHAIMAAVAGEPMKKALSDISDDVVEKINAMSPKEFQNKLLQARLDYDNKFYGQKEASVVKDGKTVKGSWWSLFGKGLTDRYKREAKQFASMSDQDEAATES